MSCTSLRQLFDEMLDRLELAFERERQFTSDASHELRTPMAVISAQCDYTLERERTTEEYMDALLVIRRQGAENDEADQSYAGFCPAGDALREVSGRFR